MPQIGDGEYCNHGAIPLGGYNLNACAGYPKTFYFVFQLIESDGNQGEGAEVLSDIMEVAADVLQGTEYAEAIAFIAAIVEALSGWLIDDDAFPPYGVAITLSDENTWGTSGRSDNMSTGNIYFSENNGKYRVEYYWQKRN